MKHTNFYLILVVFSFIQQPIFAEEQQIEQPLQQQVVVSVSQPSTQSFIEYLGNIAAVLNSDIDQSAQTTAFINKHVARTAELMANVETLFARGAFQGLPLLKGRFYAIFKNTDVFAWPTPALIRSWRNALSVYKKDITSVYFMASKPETRELDFQVVIAIISLHDELIRYVLTDDFFDFSVLEGLVDTFVARPIEFVKAHPYITAGAILALVVAGGVTYYYMSQKAALELFLEKNPNVHMVLGSQNAADCGVKALYGAWCKQAADDMEEYEELFNDKKRYSRFKRLTGQLLLRGVADREVQHPPRDRRNPTNWLENDHVGYLYTRFNQLALAKHEFGIDEDRAFFVRSRDQIIPEAVEGEIRYRDRELVRDDDGSPLVYSADEIPAERVAHCEEIRGGGLRNDLRRDIEAFRAKDGNEFDFIINTQYVTAAQREAAVAAIRAGRRPQPAVRGHFFRITAINDANAEDGVRFVVTESASPKVGVIDQVLTNLRNLLRPFDE